MTMDEFFQELGRIFSQPGGEARITPEERIIVRLPSTPTPHPPIDSPVCAVEFELHSQTSPHWHATAWERASRALDLSPEDAIAIEAATWALPGHDPALRARLMQTLRHLLPEQTAAA